MRKKTVNNLFDNIFWYILYILPVFFFILFLFNKPTEEYENYNLEPSSYRYIIPKNTSLLVAGYDSNLVSLDTVGFFGFIFPDNVGEDFSEADLNGPYYSMAFIHIQDSSLFEPVVDGPALNISVNGFTALVSFSFDISFFADSSLEYINCFALDMNYGNSIPFMPIDLSNSAVQVIPLYDDSSAVSFDFGFSQFIQGLGFGFATDNIVVNSLAEIFGANGVMPIFSTDTPFIIFAWFICVFLIHLVVDFLLFLPRLAHKWMNEFGGD